MEGWEFLILIIGLIIAAVAAIAACLSAKATKKTSLAQILMQITDAYSSPEMLSGMLNLRNWQNEHPNDFSTKFAEMRNDKDEYAKIQNLDEDRRRYSHHFYKIWLLSDRGLVNKGFVKKVATREQVDFLLEVIEPLELAINPKYDHSTFDFFRNIYHIGN
jgi:hypothetical protein